ncbi:MAG TPA: hypothetical protein VFN48_04180, partial [Solirubrobacteraceae bacterium]|nr:hypothetical protein [Solirubrobacteraceae bacterium]
VTRSRSQGGVSTSVARRRVPLISTDALRQLGEGTALLLYGRLPPVRVRLRRYFAHRRLRQLAEGHVRPREIPCAGPEVTGPRPVPHPTQEPPCPSPIRSPRS